MLSFASDYTEGAHEQILKRLAETNMEQLPGYGSDAHLGHHQLLPAEKEGGRIRRCG